MSLQPTASKTGLLLQCARPFAADVETDNQAGEAARYGIAFHEMLEERIKSPADLGEYRHLHTPQILMLNNLPGHLEGELLSHVEASFKVLEDWRSGNNIWGEVFKVVATEVHLASRIRFLRKHKGQPTVKSRNAEFNSEAHHYDLRPGEFGGTFDLLLQSPKRRVVLDHKTGDYGNFDNPALLPQMRTLAVQTDADGVAILHAMRGLPPTIHADDIPPAVKMQHAVQLGRALKRLGDGTMRPGPECHYCPAREGCPTRDAEMLVKSQNLIKHAVEGSAKLTTPLDKGKFHMMLPMVEKLARRAREELMAEVKVGAIIERPDGKVLRVESRKRKFLSMKSINDAVGPTKGAAEIARLEKLGAVTESEWEELHAR